MAFGVYARNAENFLPFEIAAFLSCRDVNKLMGIVYPWEVSLKVMYVK